MFVLLVMIMLDFLGQIVNPDIMVVVDETEVPPLVSSFSRNGIPRDRDGKRCFRR